MPFKKELCLLPSLFVRKGLESLCYLVRYILQIRLWHEKQPQLSCGEMPSYDKSKKPEKHHVQRKPLRKQKWNPTESEPKKGLNFNLIPIL